MALKNKIKNGSRTRSIALQQEEGLIQEFARNNEKRESSNNL